METLSWKVTFIKGKNLIYLWKKEELSRRNQLGID